MEDSIDDSIDKPSAFRHKIIFIGNSNVGKTSIIERIIGNPFNDSVENSIGVDFCSKIVRYNNISTKLQIWDTAGSEKYKSLIPSYIRNSSIVFIVYDLSDKQSFDDVPGWVKFVKDLDKPTLILCGNKLDLDKRVVEKSDAEKLAEDENMKYFEVSAKTNENILEMFYAVIADLPIFDEADKENIVQILKETNEDERNNVEVNSNKKELIVHEQTKNVEDENNLVKPPKQGCC